ncbi:MAG: hypothetical protein OXG35_23710, partial [Acidobacteria bacterium]|nr:hypothetical protein [Acidobacteriota bacterium]
GPRAARAPAATRHRPLLSLAPPEVHGAGPRVAERRRGRAAPPTGLSCSLSVVPLFILMGNLLTISGVVGGAAPRYERGPRAGGRRPGRPAVGEPRRG